jgi:hypothetical protein
MLERRVVDHKKRWFVSDIHAALEWAVLMTQPPHDEGRCAVYIVWRRDTKFMLKSAVFRLLSKRVNGSVVIAGSEA